MTGAQTSPRAQGVRPLVYPGSNVLFLAATEVTPAPGTTIEVSKRALRAHFERPPTQRTDGILVAVTEDRRSVEVSARAEPSGSLTDLTPIAGRVVSNAPPRVPAFAPVEIHVQGRMGKHIDGHLLELSLSSCTVLRKPSSGAVLSKNSLVVIECVLLGQPARLTGKVVGSRSLRGRDAVEIKFGELDTETWGAIEHFLDQRLERLARAGERPSSVVLKLVVNGSVVRTRLDLLTMVIDASLPAGKAVVAKMRLPGVAPVLTGAAVTELCDGGATRLRWTDIGPVTRVLLERPATEVGNRPGQPHGEAAELAR